MRIHSTFLIVCLLLSACANKGIEYGSATNGIIGSACSQTSILGRWVDSNGVYYRFNDDCTMTMGPAMETFTIVSTNSISVLDSSTHQMTQWTFTAPSGGSTFVSYSGTTLRIFNY